MEQEKRHDRGSDAEGGQNRAKRETELGRRSGVFVKVEAASIKREGDRECDSWRRR